MFGLLKKLFGPSIDVKQLLDDGAVLVDVRSPSEYKAGHVQGSMNIPLPDIAGKATKLSKFDKPIITCCESGMRSGSAARTLKSKGLEAYNGGAWRSVSAKKKE